MELNELKDQWQQSGQRAVSSSELYAMTKIKHHPSLKRIRIKLLIESLALLGFLAVYYDVFNGSEKPLWVNVLLVASAVAYVLNDIAGFFATQRLVVGETLRQSVEHFRAILRRLSLFSLSFSLFFGTSAILFLSSGVSFTFEKYLLLTGLIAGFLALSYVSYRNWMRRIRRLETITAEFQDVE